MKLRKIVTSLLMLVVTVSCCTVSTYAAELPDQRAFSFMRATGHFDMEVPGNSTVKADKEFPLEIGETVLSMLYILRRLQVLTLAYWPRMGCFIHSMRRMGALMK